MKVIATIPGSHKRPNKAAIVELTSEEMSLLIRGEPHGGIHMLEAGDQLEICKRFAAVVRVEAHMAETMGIPGHLQSFAKAFEAVVELSKLSVTPAPSPPPQLPETNS